MADTHDNSMAAASHRLCLTTSCTNLPPSQLPGFVISDCMVSILTFHLVGMTCAIWTCIVSPSPPPLAIGWLHLLSYH